MSQIYDNWERLVAATLKRELIRQLCLSHSRETSSISSQPSDFSTYPSPLPDPPFDSSDGDIEFQNIARVEENEEIHVNGEPLSVEQLSILRSCKHPPKKLQSGYYWNDKVTGFWGKGADIFKPYYNKTSAMDVHFAEAHSLVSSMGFISPLTHDGYIDSWDPKDGFVRYELSRASTDGFGDDCKWLEGFGDTRITILCISLDDYDQLVMGHNGASVNKMMVARKLFESFVTKFHGISVLLLLTKYDLFAEKIKLSPLHHCDWFKEFNPVKIDGNNYLGQMCFHFISVKFKRLYKAITGRTLYVAPVSCLAQDSVEAALKYAWEILKWDEQSEDYISEHNGDYISDESIYSDDE